MRRKPNRATNILLPALVSVLALPAVSVAQAAPGYPDVTAERLLSPEPESWLLFRRTYDGWGYSPLDEIDADNVADLRPVWTFSTGVNEGHQAPPIVNGDVMFLATPGNQVLALDARTGDMMWRYRRYLPEDLQQMHPTNRGVGLWGDKIYLATVDAFVVALDALTGEVVWEKAVEDYASGYYMTLAPLVVDGKVMVGTSGGEFGIRGFVTALDAETGDEIWKTYTIPAPGEHGSESWPDDTWRTGGVPVWVTGTYDPELDLTFWGTGNGGPWMGDQRDGDNLYSSSVLALEGATGELRGYHQYHWNDSWDWDEVSPPIVMDVERDGRAIKALVHPARNGYLWVLERGRDGLGFVDAHEYVHQNVFTSIDSETGRPSYDPEHKPGTGRPAEFCPSWWGGKNWPPAAYNPQTGLVYIPANENLCAELNGTEVEYSPGRQFMGMEGRLLLRDGRDPEHIGELQAWNIDTGEEVWTTKLESFLWGPVLTTGGGLVFMGGTNDRYFRAFDATSGEILWKQRTNSGITGVPSSFAIDGRQYVAVQSSWGVDAQRMQGGLDQLRGEHTQVPQGGVLWVFALDDPQFPGGGR